MVVSVVRIFLRRQKQQIRQIQLYGSQALAFFRLMRETRFQEHILLPGNKGVNKLFTQNGIRLHYKILVVMIEFRFLKWLSAGKITTGQQLNTTQIS